MLKTPAEKLCGLCKEDRISPTYTICVYHGTEKWDGPKSLKDMMDFGEDGERWAELFSDYQMHLICVNEIEDFSKFHTPLREFLQLLSCREDEEALNKLLSENPAFESIDEETAKAASVLMGVEMFMEKSEGKETYNMCGALVAIRKKARDEGFKLFKMLKQDGRMEDLLRAIEDNEYRDQLLQEYGLSDL